MDVDYIIVGQGVAGICLAHELNKRNLSYLAYDDQNLKSASEISSGLINPITGRKYVKSWMIDQLLPVAIETYGEIEQATKCKIINNIPIVRALHNPNDENEFYSKVNHQNYEEYMSDHYDGPSYSNVLNDTFSFARIKNSFNIDTSELIRNFKKIEKGKGNLIEEKFEYDELKIFDTHLKYKDQKANHILFAEGANARFNPYFNMLPFRPVKGEVFICELSDFPRSHILKYHKFIVPYGDDLFWIGGTYEWDFQDTSPSEKGSTELHSFLKTYMKCDWKIVDHQAAIRPATKFRKPFIGSHITYSNLHIMNGLGTKGISLAPFWAKFLISKIQEGLTYHHELPSCELN